MKQLSIRVNGNIRLVSVDPALPLVTLLREHLGLTGTKHGCSSGICGVCTVLMNGQAIKSCRTTAAEADGQDIVTIEGLIQNGDLHPLQAAFLRTGAVQCGFCTPGMILESLSLLQQNPHPDRSAIRQALRKHLCRCTGYIPIEEAVLSVSGSDQSAAPAAISEHTGVGQSPIRTDGVAKVTGAAIYSADFTCPGLCHGAVLWSPIPCGKLHHIHTDDAAQQPGVIRVITHSDIPGLNRIGRWHQDRPLLVEDRIRFIGDAIAMVIAETPEAARAGTEKIRLELEPWGGVYHPDAALQPTTLHIHPGGNIAAEIQIRKAPDIPTPPDENNHWITTAFETPFIEHALLEPEAAAAYWDGDILTVYGSSQNVFFDRLEIQRILGIANRDLHRLRIVQATMGGAFGKREDLLVQPLVALAAYLTHQPVKLVLSRAESFRATTKRHPIAIRHSSRMSSTGDIREQAIQLTADTGAYASWAPNILRKAAVHAIGPYEIPDITIQGRSVYTHSAFSGAMRGFGATQSILAAECHIDHLARQLAIDPLTFRMKLGLKSGSRTATGQSLTDISGLPPLLELAADRFGYTGPANGKKITGSIATGIGIGAAFYGIGYGNAIPDKGQVTITVHPDGKTMLYTSAIDYGQGSSTVFAQLLTETLGVPWHDIEVITGDTQQTPDSGSTVASRQTFVTGAAVIKACREVRDRLIQQSTRQNGPAPIRFHGNRWTDQDGNHLEWRVVVQCALPDAQEFTHRTRVINPTEELDPVTGLGAIYRTYAFAATIAAVSVDLKSGIIRVLRVVSAHDSGTIIHPILARSQVIGGVVMGAGMALTEQYRVENGIPLTLDFDTYTIPTCGDVPVIECIFWERPDPDGPYGAKGLGEPAMLTAAPAIVNAVSDATGIPFNAVPLTPEMVIRKLRGS